MASGGDTRFDDVLMTMAQQSGSIDGLLRAFFSFLHRRTDFYVVQPPQGASMGFPEGKAEDMVRACAADRCSGAAAGAALTIASATAPPRLPCVPHEAPPP